MAEFWPADLPQYFQTNSYSEDEGDNLLETTEAAVPKSRPKASATSRMVSGTMQLTLPQMTVFRTFGRTTLIQYSLPFWFPAHSGESDPAQPGYWLVKFRADGLPKVGMIKASLFTVSMGLHILP